MAPAVPLVPVAPSPLEVPHAAPLPGHGPGFAGGVSVAAEAEPASYGSAYLGAPPAEAAAEPIAAPVAPLVPVAAEPAPVVAPRLSQAEMASKTFEVATTRRRPVVFEEDDDLDIPDFLK